MVTFQLPAGPTNLATLFPDADFALIEEYYLKVLTGGTTILTTNHYLKLPCCPDDVLWLFFVNYAGGIDSVPFKVIQENIETKSSTWRKAVKYPLEKWDGGLQRINIQSNEIVTCETPFFMEKDMDFLKQLVSTPNAWILMKGMQGQTDDYLPVLIADGRFVTRKNEERYSYVLQLDYSMSNDNMVVRN